MSEFLLKPRICFGQDALSVLNELSARSVLLVTDKAMVKFGLAERVTALLRQRGIAWQMWGRRGGGSGYRHRGARHEADG
ncbi:iron-containing alcohol dehydrogenase [Klebsiella pneumoniae subsp. pneumoniae]|nr:iron-containing alcohol dehydrogenase [Klebsiella pneumoniae subsp. pneumoniae]